MLGEHQIGHGILVMHIHTHSIIIGIHGATTIPTTVTIHIGGAIKTDITMGIMVLITTTIITIITTITVAPIRMENVLVRVVL